MKSTSSLRYKTKYETNPFIKSDRQITIQGRTKETIKLISKHADDNQPLICKHTIVEEEQFIKLYTQHIDQWLNLTKKAQAVLKYIIKNLKPNKDKITININTLSDYTKYNSYGPLYSGINELIEAQLLSRTRHELVYYINPNFIFNGNRIYLAELIERSSLKEYPMDEGESHELPEGFDADDLVDV